eukprot:g52700.t1
MKSCKTIQTMINRYTFLVFYRFDGMGSVAYFSEIMIRTNMPITMIRQRPEARFLPPQVPKALWIDKPYGCE